MSGRAALYLNTLDTAGNVLPGASITVYEEDGTTLIAQSIYAAPSGGAPEPNPTTSSSLGYGFIFAPNAQRCKVKIGTQTPVYAEFQATAEDQLYLTTSGRILNRAIGPGLFQFSSTYIAPAPGGLGSVVNTPVQVLMGSFANPVGYQDAAVIISKFGNAVFTDGANTSLFVQHRLVSGDHATGVQVEVYLDPNAGLHFGEAIRASANATGAATVTGVVEAFVGTASADADAYPATMQAFESANIFYKWNASRINAPLGSAIDLAAFPGDADAGAFDSTRFRVGYYAANGFNGAGGIADAFYYGAAGSTVKARVEFLAGGQATEAAYRGLGSPKYGLDLGDMTPSRGAIRLPSGGKIRGAWNGGAGTGTAVFQTDTSFAVNGATNLSVIPVGSGGTSSLNLYNTAAATSAGFQMLCTSTPSEARFNAFDAGAGAPFMSFYTAGAEQLRIAAVGDITLKATKVGVFGVTPVVRQASITQTYSTADPTLSAYTANVQSSAFTGIATGVGGTPYAQLTDLNLLRVAYENLRAFVEDAVQLQNTTINYMKSYGWFQS